MEKQTKMKKSTKYLLIGTLVLFLSILGASMAYYLARVSGNLSGRAAGTELTLTINKVSNTNDDLIPLDNDVETLNQAILGYGNTSNNFDSAKSCLDINNYSVCQVYKITLTNNGSVPVTVNSKVELSGANTPNIDCTTMDDEKSVSNSNSCIGDNTLANNDTINGNKSKDYYVVVYIKNLDVPQTDKGEFNGTITFTSTQGDQVKGRFKQSDTLVQHITKLYTDNKDTTVTNNNIEYQYATAVNLMNDRLGGTTTSLDGGNIRYYGASPNNYIDIGDVYREGMVTTNNWEIFGEHFNNSSECQAVYTCNNPEIVSELGFSSVEECENGVDAIIDHEAGSVGIHTLDDICYSEEKYVREPILWRIIGVFDGKLRIKRDEDINENLSFDTSASNVNNGYGVNEWSQADLMKLLNPGFENNLDKDRAGNDITVNNSLYWSSKSGNCYLYDNNADAWKVDTCDFINSGLSEESKKYVVNQTLYLGGFDTADLFPNQAYTKERSSNVIQNPIDGITRTLSWTGKVGLIYPSDVGYAADLSDSSCQNNIANNTICTKNWLGGNSFSWTISPSLEEVYYEMVLIRGIYQRGFARHKYGAMPTLTLDPSLLFDDTTDGSLEHPYKIVG